MRLGSTTSPVGGAWGNAQPSVAKVAAAKTTPDNMFAGVQCLEIVS